MKNSDLEKLYDKLEQFLESQDTSEKEDDDQEEAKAEPKKVEKGEGKKYSKESIAKALKKTK